jgi:acyl-coenzyme A synthetase/AMP-(fatty) acid ligase
MGAPITGEEKAAARRALGSEIVESWGNSESLGTITDPEDLDVRPDSIGRPFLSDEMCVVGDDCKTVNAREIGRIAGGQEAGFFQYSGRPEATLKVKQEDLIISEDVGYVDEAGYFYVRGRVQDAVLRNGTTVFIPELEAKLRAILGTDDCCACAIGDEAKPRIYCLTTSTETLKVVDETVKRVNEHLSQAESLDAILVVPSIPRLPAGKIDRVRARDLLQDRLTAIGMV